MRYFLLLFLFVSAKPSHNSEVDFNRIPYYMAIIEQKQKQGTLDKNQIKQFLNDRER